MGTTVEGGAYLNPDGKTWHDAQGNPIDAPTVKEAQALAKEQAAEDQQAEAALKEQAQQQPAATARR